MRSFTQSKGNTNVDQGRHHEAFKSCLYNEKLKLIFGKKVSHRLNEQTLSRANEQNTHLSHSFYESSDQ
jgi:hypothetical protein